MLMSPTDLKIYQKAEVLEDNCEPYLKNFPKFEKNELCKYIRMNFTELLKYIILANESRAERRRHQDAIESRLALIIVFFNKAYNKKYITEKVNRAIQFRVKELGRMLGGWKKSNYRK